MAGDASGSDKACVLWQFATCDASVSTNKSTTLGMIIGVSIALCLVLVIGVIFTYLWWKSQKAVLPFPASIDPRTDVAMTTTTTTTTQTSTAKPRTFALGASAVPPPFSFGSPAASRFRFPSE